MEKMIMRQKYKKRRKILTLITISLLILDTLASLMSPLYLSSLSSLTTLGITIGGLLQQYYVYQTKEEEISVVPLCLLVGIAGFSLYHIILNVIRMI